MTGEPTEAFLFCFASEVSSDVSTGGRAISSPFNSASQSACCSVKRGHVLSLMGDFMLLLDVLTSWHREYRDIRSNVVTTSLFIATTLSPGNCFIIVPLLYYIVDSYIFPPPDLAMNLDPADHWILNLVIGGNYPHLFHVFPILES